MTTNQTIDGVPRKLLENCANYTEGSASYEVLLWHKELRALLDSDECCHEFVPFQANCTKCGIPYKTAAQPQGEPVAELQVAFFEHGPMATINWFTPSAFEPGATKLYAKQPAPVVIEHYKNKVKHLKQLLRNVRATLHFSPEDVLAIDAALREDGE